MLCPPLGTHLHVALAVGASNWGRGALHAKLSQEPHGLEQEHTVPEQDLDHSEAPALASTRAPTACVHEWGSRGGGGALQTTLRTNNPRVPRPCLQPPGPKAKVDSVIRQLCQVPHTLGSTLFHLCSVEPPK